MKQSPKVVLANSLEELLKKRSFDNITVGEIADNCGLSRTTFYRQFKAASPEHYAAYCAGIPAKRTGEMAEFCKPVMWLCSDDASYVSGAMLRCDGGLNT